MMIADLARAGGVGVETVRYYQRRGLMETPKRPVGGAAGGLVRRYDATHLQRLRFIRAAQSAGFTLDEIGELIRLDATTDRRRVRALARERLVALDDKIVALQQARDALARLADLCGDGSPGPCPIIASFEAPGIS